MAKDYILYDYIPHRPFRRPPRPPSPWPSPMLKQGPYWVIPTEQGLQCTPRRGTRAYKRMLKRQAEQKQAGEFVVAFFVAIVGALALNRNLNLNPIGACPQCTASNRDSAKQPRARTGRSSARRV